MKPTVTHTGFDKVRTLKQGNDSIRFTYGYDHQRISMQELTPGTNRAKDYVGSCEFITKSVMGGTDTKSLTYLSGPYGVFAVMESHNGTETLHYILKDNLGSWVTITNANGTVEQQMSFDAWGTPYYSDSANLVQATSLFFDRGFTGHEHLVDFDLINMNGRVYDPFTSSFLSVDNYVQDPSYTQNFNRYAYCMNNPLKYTDPDGEFFILDSWLVGFVSKFISTGSLKQSWNEANKRAGNDAKIWGGLFVTDNNKNFWERTWEFISRLSWQAPQTFVGWFWSINTN